MNETIPVALFAYARPDHLRQTLEGLRANQIPLIYAFSDGPRTPNKASAVTNVRQILRAIDWCEVVLCERDENWGLGKSILAGVGRVLEQHDAVIVFEDDLVCVPGTYQYLTAALNHYRDDTKVMSVTGWTHPDVIPHDVTDQPYFDGRAECWVWGTWARVWEGMDQSAQALMRTCKVRGIDVYRYGVDLPRMAEAEKQQNIWAVRFLYLHILHRGLCLRPPYSMVEHIGFDALATNASDGRLWASAPLRTCPPLPDKWPVPLENSECPRLWQAIFGAKPSWSRRMASIIRRVAAKAVPS